MATSRAAVSFKGPLVFPADLLLLLRCEVVLHRIHARSHIQASGAGPSVIAGRRWATGIHSSGHDDPRAELQANARRSWKRILDSGFALRIPYWACSIWRPKLQCSECIRCQPFCSQFVTMYCVQRMTIIRSSFTVSPVHEL